LGYLITNTTYFRLQLFGEVIEPHGGTADCRPRSTQGTPKKLLLPPPASDDSSRHRIPRWFTKASGHNRLIKDGRRVEEVKPLPRRKTPWAASLARGRICHAWTDGSFCRSGGLGWVVTADSLGPSAALHEGARNIGGQQTAFDAEVAAIEQVLKWFLRRSTHRHMTIHSDSTSAIARAQHEGVGPGQRRAINIQSLARACRRAGKTTDIIWVKGHEGTPGNERADILVGKAAEKLSHSRVVSLAHLKLQISEKFRTAKTAWDTDQRHHRTEAIPPPPPKKSCLDKMRNSLARTAAQIRTGHWRSAVYLKRIRKRAEDDCWCCQGPAKMTRSHVLLHCPSEKLQSARREAWEGKNPRGVRVLLANPRWERRFVRFLELSGVGRTMVDGTDEGGAHAARMDEWIAWETEEVKERGGDG